MTKGTNDVQVALLYRETPQVDFENFILFFGARARNHGLPGPYEAKPVEPPAQSLCLTGSGVCVTVTVQDQALDAAAFDLPLRAPILRQKSFDFCGTIEAHQASVVITVSDGETPVPVDDGNSASDDGAASAADLEVKLTILHMAMQAIVAMHPPLLADFRPSQLLLTPQEIAAVATMGLPVPILFHPFPIKNGKDASGAARQGMAAIHAHRLIGAELELEAIPQDIPMDARIDALASLIALKMEGELPLEHGDTLTSDDGMMQRVRHAPGSADGGPHRIIVSYDTQAPKIAHGSGTNDNTSFQDRVARLKSRAPRETPMAIDPVPAAALTAAESEDELRARVRDTINPDAGFTRRSGLMNGPIKIVVVITLLGGFFLFGPSKQISEMTEDGGSIIQGAKTLFQSPEYSTSTRASSDTRGMVRSIGQGTRRALRP